MPTYAEREVQAIRQEITQAVSNRVDALLLKLNLKVPDRFRVLGMKGAWMTIAGTDDVFEPSTESLIHEQNCYEYHKNRAAILATHRAIESEVHRMTELRIISDLMRSSEEGGKGLSATRAEKEVDRDEMWQHSNAWLLVAREAERLAETELSIARERLRTVRALVTGKEGGDATD